MNESNLIRGDLEDEILGMRVAAGRIVDRVREMEAQARDLGGTVEERRMWQRSADSKRLQLQRHARQLQKVEEQLLMLDVE